MLNIYIAYIRIIYPFNICRMNDVYVTWYINWARLIVLGIVPIISITYLNLKIYLAIRRRLKGRRRRDDTMSVVLMVIVMVFIVCNVPRIFLNMHEITVIHQVNRHELISPENLEDTLIC